MYRKHSCPVRWQSLAWSKPAVEPRRWPWHIYLWNQCQIPWSAFGECFLGVLISFLLVPLKLTNVCCFLEQVEGLSTTRTSQSQYSPSNLFYWLPLVSVSFRLRVWKYPPQYITGFYYWWTVHHTICVIVTEIPAQVALISVLCLLVWTQHCPCTEERFNVECLAWLSKASHQWEN